MNFNSNYDGITEFLADTIYKQIKRKPAVETEFDELPVPTDITFTIEGDNSAEYEIMEKVAKILENKRIKTSPRCNPMKLGFTGCIKTSKEKQGEKIVFHFLFDMEEITTAIA